VKNVTDRLTFLREELSELKEKTKKAKPVSQTDYENLLRKAGSDKQYEELIQNGHKSLKELISSKQLSLEAFKEIVAHAGVITCCAANLLAPGLPQAQAEIKALDEEFLLGLTTEGERSLRENSIVQASFRTTAIPGLIQNFWKHYRENPDYWAPLYDGHIHSQRLYTKEKKESKKKKEIIRRVAHDRVTRLVGHKAVDGLVALKKNLVSLAAKSERFKKLGDLYSAKSKEVVTQKVTSTEHQYAVAFKEAVSRLQEVITARPGILEGHVPKPVREGDVVLTPPKSSEELKLATQLLEELVEMESQ